MRFKIIGYHLCQIQLAIVWFLAWIGVSVFVGAACAQSEINIDPSPSETVNRLMSAVSQRSDQDTEELVAALWKLGETAMPAIEAGISQGDDSQRVQLVRALGGIGSDSSTSLLLEQVANRAFPKAADRALSGLGNRTVRRSLTSEELQVLTDLVQQDNIMKAGFASRVLARCIEVAAKDRFEPIVIRFKKELTLPSKVGRVSESYLSPRAYVRNQFLVAFADIGESAISSIMEERIASSGNVNIEKWWVLALGMAGDKNVSSTLCGMILDGESDRYVRSLAIKAYARSSGADAIPLLQTLLTDSTQSEYMKCNSIPVQLIGIIASDELARLRRLTSD